MYTLVIANRNYSSWSLRPWVLLKVLDIPFDERIEQFESMNNFEKFRSFSPSGTVPCLMDGDVAVWDSLAIVEYLAERHEGIWPGIPAARAFARSVTAEMHSGFSELRGVCPMNCAITVTMRAMPDGLQRDLSRIDEIWAGGTARFGGPFLAGERFTAADAFYCPVAFRVRSYQLPLSDAAAAYCQRLLDLPAMKAWDAAAVKETWREPQHEKEAAEAGRIIADRRL